MMSPIFIHTHTVLSFSVSFEVFVAMENGKASIDANYVLRVNIQCCNECPRKITRRLLRVSGVYSVAIDMAEGLVQIGGKDNLDPSILIKTVATAGKRAHLQSVEKTTAAAAAAVDSGQPSNPSGNATDESCNNTGRSQNGNSGSGHFSDRGGRYGQIHINEAAAVKPPPRNWPFMRPPLQFGGVGFGGSRGLRPLLPPPMVPMPPPVPPPYGYYRWSELPPHGYNQPEPPPEVPPAYGYCWLPEPPPEAPSCWQQHPPPIVNAPEHYLFSDENIEGCTVV